MDPLVLMEAWMGTYPKPSTVVSLSFTLRKMVPDLWTTECRTFLDAIRQLTGVRNVNPGKTMNPSDLVEILRSTTRDIRWTLLVQWLSASRHRDLERLWAQEMHFPNTLALHWNTFKSDRFGQRGFSKFIVQPLALGSIPRYASYTRVQKVLKKVGYGTKSLRRGAAQYLGEMGYSDQEIALLTGHAPTCDPNLAVRRYKYPSPEQPESLKQRAMSDTLWEALRREWVTGKVVTSQPPTGISQET